ncbi:cytochrome P450 [Ktedonospora formicarum]|uniref:Putative cytochrome P450 YjiB n=1 Tax=Ktedonospora formicarum TaxID=2778364 RepID=A0A8J3HZM6_9CHLR|nr:cytochrome P450 [Ktedonospora formicarum]GHO42859.1 putative cytochrome P450 YjiB [Ktedonospora formicarum]
MEPRSLQDQLLYPHECFTILREAHGPIMYNSDGRFWEIFDYEDVHYILTKHELFSSDSAKYSRDFEDQDFQSMLNTDPPRHRQLRSLVTQAFTPRSLAQLIPRIAEITHELLDDVEARGSMDVIYDLSFPLPVIVIAELLGVPAKDRARFKVWSDELVMGEYSELASMEREAYIRRVRERFRETREAINNYFRDVIAQRRREPRQDLISALISAQIDGDHLTEQELLNFCLLLLVAGNITTTNLIGNAFLCFDEHPESMERLRRNPELIPSALEEVLRYRSPVTAIGRFAVEDLVLCDQKIGKGDFILGWVASANHDPAQFSDPGMFDIERNPNRHVSFGHGIHFCLGAPLARLEAKIALGIMLERLEDIRRDRAQPLPPVHSSFIYGAKSLPITFAAHARAATR